MRRTFTLALVIALAMPTVAQAQGNYAPDAGSLTYSGDQTSNGKIAGQLVGPYKAQFKDFAPTLNDALTPGFASIWCVDFTHSAPLISEWDTYYVTAFDANSIGSDGNGDYSKTRGFAASFGDSNQKNTQADKLYRQAAWLIERYDPTMDGLLGMGLYNATNIQGTIWNLFGAGLAANGSNNFFGLYVAPQAAPTRDWFVLSDRMSSGEVTSNQEFLTYRARPEAVIVEVPSDPPLTTTETTTSTPEPSTYALMASGLIALGIAARRRRVVGKA